MLDSQVIVKREIKVGKLPTMAHRNFIGRGSFGVDVYVRPYIVVWQLL